MVLKDVFNAALNTLRFGGVNFDNLARAVENAETNKVDYILAQRQLMKEPFSLDEQIHGGETLLTSAPSVEIAQKLVTAGADINAPNRNGAVPVNKFISDEREDLALFCLEQKNVKLNQKTDFMKMTTLFLAMENLPGIAAKIIAAAPDEPVDMTAEDRQGNTFLHRIGINGLTDLIDTVIARKGNVYQTNNQGSTPLIEAVIHDHIDTAAHFIKRNSNIDARNKTGMSALMYAARNGNVAMLAMLSDAGADLTLKNDENLTAYDIARLNGHAEAVDFLKAQYAAQNLPLPDSNPLKICVGGMSGTGLSKEQFSVIHALREEFGLNVRTPVAVKKDAPTAPTPGFDLEF